MKILIALIFPVFLLLPAKGMETAHEFHLSKCIIDYAPEEKSFQIMLHVFLDDFELALGNNGAKNLKLCTDKEVEGADQYIFDYLKERLSVSINSETQTYNYIGKENSEDLLGVWIYLEIENLEHIQNVEINNSILTEVFDDQQNLIQIKGPGGRRGMMILNKEKTTEAVTF